MLMPRRMKYRKQQRGRLKGATKGGDYVAFGDFGLVALEPAWITAQQIEAARVAMVRHFRRGGKIFIRIFPDKPYTKKPLEGYVAVVKPGRVMFEVAGVTEEQAMEALRIAGHKLPIKTKIVRRDAYDEAQ